MSLLAVLALLASGPAAGADADFQLPATTAAPRIDFKAENMVYDQTAHIVDLSGNVSVTDSTFTLRSDHIQADLDRQTFDSPVPMSLTDNKGTGFTAKSGHFDFPDREGTFHHFSGSAAPWVFSSREAAVNGKAYKLRGATITSCDRQPPDYHFTATSLSLVPNVHFIAWNAVFFLGKVPLFYFPFFYKGLEPDPLIITKVNFGYDQRNGGEIYTDNRIRVGHGFTERVYLDYFTNQNPGVGNEVDYRRPDGSRGTLYTYWVRDRSLDIDRWTVLGDVWQRIDSTYYFQSRLERSSDPSFNNAYFRSNQIRVAADQTNSMALVRQTTVTTTRLSVSRHEVLDPLNPNKFERQSEDAPRLDFSAAPFKLLGLPILNNFSAFGDHSLDPSLQFYENTAGATDSLTQTFKLARNVSFVPSVGVSEQYQDKILTPVSSGTLVARDQYTGRYFTTADLRFHSVAGDSTFGHRWTRRFALNTTTDDSGAPDHGEEQNLVTALHSYLPTYTTRVQIQSGYDLRQDQRGAPAPMGFHDRLQPLILDTAWLPKPLLALLARETYRLGSQGQQSILVAADYGLPGQNRWGVSLAQNAGQNGHVLSGLTFGWFPHRSSWTVEGALRFDILGTGDLQHAHVERANLFEKELNVARVWHDFVTRLSFRERPGGVLEYQARVDFRIGPGVEQRNQDYQQEFYPWRQGLTEK